MQEADQIQDHGSFQKQWQQKFYIVCFVARKLQPLEALYKKLVVLQLASRNPIALLLVILMVVTNIKEDKSWILDILAPCTILL